MNNKHEVEYRALIDNINFNSFYEFGKKTSPHTFRGPITIEDTYFCPKSVTSFKDVEMDKIGSYGLRLRREIIDGSTEITLNAKALTKENDHRSGLEHETRVNSFEECRGILELIGFKAFFTIQKERYSYKDGEIHVCLESIKDFQPVIEVEIVTTEEHIAEAREKLFKFLGDHNIPETAIVKKSITNMLMKERSVFKN